MDEINRQIRILVLFIIFVFFLILFLKSDLLGKVSKIFPFKLNVGRCNIMIDNLCLSEDTGLNADYYTASSICSKKGMSLPSLEDAWLLWISSENCKQAFASNEMIYADKEAFVNVCSDYGTCLKPASKIQNYCTNKSVIKFSRASQHKYGNFWLKNNTDANSHYSINFYNGKLSTFKDKEQGLGVRCVVRK